MNKSRTVYVMKNTTAGMVVKILSLVLNFVLKTVFIKVLGIQYTGVSSLFTDILTLLSFAELGIGSAITYALYKPIAQNDETKITQLMAFYKTAYRFVAIVVFSIGCLLIPFLDLIVTDVPDIKENIRLIYFLYILNTSISYLLIYKSSILVAKQKNYIVSEIQAIISMLKMVLESVILLLLKEFLAYLVADIAITVLQNLIISYYGSKEYDAAHEKESEPLDKSEKKKILKDIAAISIYKVSGVVAKGTDSVIISSMLGTSLVGVLSYYKLIVNSVISFITQFFTASNASVGNLAAESDSETQYKLFSSIDFAVFWIVSFCSTCLFVLMRPFIRLWLGEELLLSNGIVFALVLDFFFTCMIETVGLFRTANGLFVQGKLRPAIMVLINIFLSVALARPLGMFGVLIATAFSRLVTQVWFDPWLVYRHVFKKNVLRYYGRYLLYMLTTVVSVICSLVLSDLLNNLKISELVMFVLQMLLCVVVPNILIVLFWHRTEAFYDCLKRFHNMVKKFYKK